MGTADMWLLGTALLRLSPLVLSSASLMFSFSQDCSLGAFLHTSLREDAAHPSGRILPRYLPAFMKPGIWGIAVTFSPATILCVINGFGTRSPEARNMYWVGAAFSIAHFCWGPTMFAILARIGDIDTAGVPNENALEEWLSKHLAPNLYLEAKAPKGSADVARLQASYDGAHGARAIHSLQNYGNDKHVYNSNAYTFSSTYHAGTGTLQLYRPPSYSTL
ncbi:hypothetical protein F4818DRAFT_438693 [Hypoxylon cercidicola]|nr:hypothetical protein F4818DRAFT_438693 [Hypoxylon cercidicola]